MNRLWVWACLSALVLGSALPGYAASSQVVLPIHNETLVQNLREEDDQAIQVVSFFSYGCQWCYRLEPQLKEWLAQLPEGVAFRRVPVVFHSSWRLLAKAYYVIEHLADSHPTLHEQFFQAVQSNPAQFNTEPAIASFFHKSGVDMATFDALYQSFSMNRQIKNSYQLLRLYQVTAVPSFAINTADAVYPEQPSAYETPEAFFEALNARIKALQDAA